MKHILMVQVNYPIQGLRSNEEHIYNSKQLLYKYKGLGWGGVGRGRGWLNWKVKNLEGRIRFHCSSGFRAGSTFVDIAQFPFSYIDTKAFC